MEIVEDIKGEKVDVTFTQDVKDVFRIHIQDRSGHRMVRIFRMYHVGHIAEGVIKIVIPRSVTEIQLIAYAPHQEGGMMFIFAYYLLKGLILDQGLVGVMIEAVRVRTAKRQTNDNGQFIRF